MNTLETIPTGVQTQPALTPLQQMIATKLTQTTNKIVKDIFTSILSFGSMKSNEFVKTHVTPKQNALNGIDERTNKFFQKIVKAVNEELDKFSSLSGSFAVLAYSTEDAEIRKKLVEGMALQPVKELIVDLDNIKSSIVDDIINS